MFTFDPIQVNQKRVGAKFQAQDANGDAVVPQDGVLVLSVNQAGTLTFSGITALASAAPGTDPDFPLGFPAGSTFSVDIIGNSVSTGASIITAAGHASDGTLFQTQASIMIVANPNAPGPPVKWVITQGTVVLQ